MSSPETLIELRGVSVTEGDFTILQPTSLDFKRGLTAIVGPSGSGKTTLANVTYGLIPPNSGVVDHVGVGQGFTRLSTERAGLFSRVSRSIRLESLAERVKAEHWSRYMGYIAQSPYLDPKLTAGEYIELPHRARGNNLDMVWVSQIARELGIQSELDKLPVQLSGGQLQRVAITAALAHKPEVVIADEPTADLDSENSERTFELFRHIADTTGISIIFVSHEPSASEYAHNVVHVSDGRATTGY